MPYTPRYKILNRALLVLLCLPLLAFTPLPRPDFAADDTVPDTAIYREIFTLQSKALWDRTDRLISRLEDTSLMGHVLYQRYMHPHGYRARWTELRDWLKNYADQPNAWRVYKLAIKRKPAGITMPKQPPERVYYHGKTRNAPSLFTRYHPRRIKAHIYDLVRRERPSQALRYVRRNAKRLSKHEQHFLKSLIARSYYIEGKVEESLKLAEQAVASHRLVPLANWHAGLASYRLDNMEGALAHFQTLAYNPNASERLRGSAAFWAGRSLRHMGQIEKAEGYFRQAAGSGTSFYALLAMQYITDALLIEWHNREAPDDGLFATHPAIRRAELLRASNQSELAERELLFLHERLSTNEARALLAYTNENDYPAVQLLLAERFQANDIKDNVKREAVGLPLQLYENSYPVPDFVHTAQIAAAAAKNGNANGSANGKGKGNAKDTLDKALLYALIRQESRFKARARSHAGARGLMQIMPQTAAFISGNRSLSRRNGRDQLLDATLNITLGQRYLALLMSEKYFENNLVLAIAAYNAGPGNLQRWQGQLESVTDPLLFIESLPASETRVYIKKVLGNLWIYRSRLGQASPSRRILAAESWPSLTAQD